MDSMNNFTPRAQQAISLARREVERLSHSYICTEHLLLGIIGLGQGIAIDILDKMGVDLEAIKVAIEQQFNIHSPDKNHARGTNILFSQRVKAALIIAGQEAKKLCQPYIGTEHILLGIIDDVDNIAARILKSLNIY